MSEDDKPQKSSPYPLSRLSPRYELVDVAREIEQADGLLGTVVSGKLDVIADQIRALQAEARRILESAKQASDLHRAACNFKKRPGAVYHLYERSEGELYFSLLGPDEWGGSPPHAFKGTYRLELDMNFPQLAGGAPAT